MSDFSHWCLGEEGDMTRQGHGIVPGIALATPFSFHSFFFNKNST